MIRFFLARIHVLFILVFVVLAGCALVYQQMYLDPARKCEEAGMWWASEWRACATPIEIEKFTGRPTPSLEEVRARDAAQAKAAQTQP